jgi:hypothetical protein
MRNKQLWRLLREPLLHFCLIGALIYATFGLINDNQEVADNVIVVSSERVFQLRSLFESTWKRPPTTEELDNLIEGHVREEIYYRDAVSLALDQNDALVRRRMHQKMEFLIDTGSYLEEPAQSELEAYYAANDKTYYQSPRLAFEQIYLGENPDADQITKWLTALNSDQATDRDAISKRSFLPDRLGLSTSEVVNGVFGQGFFEQLAQSQQGTWIGPVESAFSIHLVRITDRVPGRTPDLDEIRDLVRKHWREARAIAVRENDYAQRRSRFNIRIERDDKSMSSQIP